MIGNGIFGGTLFSDKSHSLVQRNVSRFQFPNQCIEHQSMYVLHALWHADRFDRTWRVVFQHDLDLVESCESSKSHRLANSGNS